MKDERAFSPGSGNASATSDTWIQPADAGISSSLPSVSCATSNCASWNACRNCLVRPSSHSTQHSPLKVTLDHFYGIEIDEWPARIAETAMFLVDRQCDLKLKERFGEAPQRLPIQT